MLLTERCEVCKGYGTDEDNWSRDCYACDGTGEVENYYPDEDEEIDD